MPISDLADGQIEKLVKSRARTSWIQLSCLHSFGVDEVKSFLMVWTLHAKLHAYGSLGLDHETLALFLER
jgi:hypothetical protein